MLMLAVPVSVIVPASMRGVHAHVGHRHLGLERFGERRELEPGRHFTWVSVAPGLRGDEVHRRLLHGPLRMAQR